MIGGILTEVIDLLNGIVGVLFFVCFSYQFFYILVPYIKKAKPHRDVTYHNYAVLISARNEEAVISGLVESVLAQNYPQEKLHVFVVADNCTDATAEAARAAGATVFERTDHIHVGKGYALDYLFGQLDERYGHDAFDAFFIFDADNLLDENYVAEMNQTFCDGYEIVTSCRNSKNYGDNWISAGYALWFLRDSQFLNRPRMLLGTSSVVAGTGFLFSRAVLDRCGGWKFFLLSEDTEFTARNILDGQTIAYCDRAVFYDEQPTDFGQSCRQRMRWARGYLQVFGKYGSKLTKGMFRGKFACFDMIMSTMPAIVLMIAALIVNVAGFLACIVKEQSVMGVLGTALFGTVQGYLTFLFVGAFTTIAEWEHIHCPAGKKILYMFTFPLFMLTYIPVSIAAVFKKAEWRPIRHTVAVSVKEIRAKGVTTDSKV